MSLINWFECQIKDFNKKPLTEKDFFRICKKEGIFFTEDDTEDMEWRGLYTMLEDSVPCIIINGHLKGLERLWAMFHELGHHLLHSPATCFFSHATVNKLQSEANMFAAYALIPEKVARQMPLWEIYDLDEFAVRLFQIRLDFFEIYKR